MQCGLGLCLAFRVQVACSASLPRPCTLRCRRANLPPQGQPSEGMAEPCTEVSCWPTRQRADTPWMSGLWSGPSTTLKGQCLMSCCTAGSVNLRPIRRFTSYTVLRGFRATCARRAPNQAAQRLHRLHVAQPRILQGTDSMVLRLVHGFAARRFGRAHVQVLYELSACCDGAARSWGSRLPHLHAA
jgi:hypothetical protein